MSGCTPVSGSLPLGPRSLIRSPPSVAHRRAEPAGGLEVTAVGIDQLPDRAVRPEGRRLDPCTKTITRAPRPRRPAPAALERWRRDCVERGCLAGPAPQPPGGAGHRVRAADAAVAADRPDAPALQRAPRGRPP